MAIVLPLPFELHLRFYHFPAVFTKLKDGTKKKRRRKDSVVQRRKEEKERR